MQNYSSLFPLKTLTPPQNPKEAVESRRNPCYGFAIIADIQEHKELVTILAQTRDEILKIVDPDRASKQRPIRSPLYIKQKYFHASVFGMSPLLDEKQYFELYASEKGLLNFKTMDTMCETLQTHLKTRKPFLEPVSCEMIEKDGTILARFAYKTEEKADAVPLFTLASQLDPTKKFSNWDSSNQLRYTTVAVAICVVDKDKMSEKLGAIQKQLQLAELALKKLGNIAITQFQFISHYNKRTLSLKHISMYANVASDSIAKLVS